MLTKKIINLLAHSGKNIYSMLSGLEKEEIMFRPHANHWNLLEIICHLYDEEREDFRARIYHLIQNPGTPPPHFNPTKWVTERDYINADFESKLESFRKEREASIKRLSSITEAELENSYIHNSAGELNGTHFLHNWLAHDYLHTRQITKVKYEYLKSCSPNVNFEYAGNWVL